MGPGSRFAALAASLVELCAQLPARNQNVARDLAGAGDEFIAQAQRDGAKYLMLTHLIPSLGANEQYPFKVPGRPLTDADYRKAVQDGGFTGTIIVGTDLTSLRVPTK